MKAKKTKLYLDSGLGLVATRMLTIIKQNNEIIPPIPSFHKARRSPARANPQIIKVIIKKGLNELEPGLPCPSSISPIPMNKVKKTINVPTMRAVQRIILKTVVFFIFLEFLNKYFSYLLYQLPRFFIQ
jgi:hypothetical protein